MEPQIPTRPPRAARAPVSAPKPSRWDRFIYQGKIQAAFWNVASLASLFINVILLIMVLLLGSVVFALKGVVQDQLITGLSENFQAMDQAHIVTTIQVKDQILVEDQIAVVFNLPLQQQTTVVLTQDTPVNNATVYLNGQPIPTDIVLRRGTPLNIFLDLSVPVSQTVPVQISVPISLTVPVDIALASTGLHTPFEGLQNVLLPYQTILGNLPDSWLETPMCGPLTNWACRRIFGEETP